MFTLKRNELLANAPHPQHKPHTLLHLNLCSHQIHIQGVIFDDLWSLAHLLKNPRPYTQPPKLEKCNGQCGCGWCDWLRLISFFENFNWVNIQCVMISLIRIHWNWFRSLLRKVAKILLDVLSPWPITYLRHWWHTCRSSSAMKKDGALALGCM